ncbi:MAG: Ig-like domain-containing protein [Candidatus Thorarchaeota archaeon]
MIKKSMTLVFVLLMLSPLLTMTNQVTMPRAQNINSEKVNTIAETDLTRVDWETNVMPNRGFESWSSPSRLEDISISISMEQSSWLESTIVSEGAKSAGFEVRTLDSNNYAQARLTQDNWTYWANPVNTTLSLDWYLDEIGDPNDVDYFRMEVQMNNRDMYYYLGCDTGYTNGSAGYFMIDGPVDTWNHLQRNITRDYIEVFSEVPTRFDLVYIFTRSYTNDYTRAYVDDFSILNGTDVRVGGSHNNGDFEGGGGWVFTSASDPAVISQSSLAYAGDWSLNMTAISYGDLARASANVNADKRLSPINNGLLSFNWRIADWVNSSLDTISNVRVTVSNTTESMSMYYYLCVGGAGSLPINEDIDMNFQVTGFNITDQWNFFNRNIWEDFHTKSTTDELWIDNIIIEVKSSEDDSRLSVLFDELNFTASIVNDMGYETQGAIGTPIEGWNEPTSDPEFSVTDFAFTGSRAANITLEDDQDFSQDQQFGSIPIGSSTELILDFNIYIDTFNESSDDFIFFDIEFGDTEISYIIANSSSEVESWVSGEDYYFILLQENTITGEWMNFEIDLVHTYESITGSLPNTTLESIGLTAMASHDSRLVSFLDDLYIYYDIGPEITGVEQSPTVVDEAGELVSIFVEVIDGSEVTVTFSYRVDSGDWINVTMNETTDGNFTININAPWGVTEYFVTAEDAFGNIDTAMDGGDYFTFTTTDTIAPVITLTPANGATVSDIVSIEITVLDAGSGFAGAELFIEGASIANISLDTIGVSWDTNVIPNGEYNITVVAEDNAGNTASVTHIVTVENVGSATDYMIFAILIAVIIIAVGAVLVIYLFVIKKR